MNHNNPAYGDLVALALGEVGDAERLAIDSAASEDPSIREQLGQITRTLSSIRPADFRLDDDFNRRLEAAWLGEISQESAPAPLATRAGSTESRWRIDYAPRTAARSFRSRLVFMAGVSAVIFVFGVVVYLYYYSHRRVPASFSRGVSPPLSVPGLVVIQPEPVINQQTVPPGTWPMFGGTPLRNAVSTEKNPPTDWDIRTGKNILWSAAIGSKSYGNPIVTQGIVTIGTNNEGHRDPSHQEDGGVEMAFDQATGKFLWQAFYPKLPTGRVNDWPYEGLASTAYSEPGRLWYCTNTCHVVCLDLSSSLHMPDGLPVVVWDIDMIDKLGVFPHNMTSSSIAALGDFIYVITGNGVDDTHKHVVAPQAPDIVCFDKNTGKIVWTDNSPGESILHGQWSSVAIAEVNGRALVIAPLGDAWVYAFDAKTGKIIWKFDTNPKDGLYPQTRNEVIAMPCIVGKFMYIANGQDPEHGEGYGHMYCVDITGEGDVSEELDINPAARRPRLADEELLVQPEQLRLPKGKPNPNSKVVWHFDVAQHAGRISRSEHMNRTISTAVVTPEGLCIVPDFSGFLHCFDAMTGQHYWSYDMEAAVWGSPLYADGLVYVTDENGEVEIFKASRTAPTKKDVIVHDIGNPSYCSPVLVNGVLYITTRERLFAIKAGVQGTPVKPE